MRLRAKSVPFPSERPKSPQRAAPVAHGTASCERQRKGEGGRMSDAVIFPPSPEWKAHAFADDASYRSMHAAALEDPEAFWGHHGRRLDWIKPYTKVKDV